MNLKSITVAVSLLCASPFPAFAADSDALKVENPYARAVPPTAQNSGAFMVLRNESDRPIKVVDAESDVSKVTELHTHIHDKGVMRMRRVESIEVPAKGTVVLQPGGYHVMLIGLKHPLKPGDPVHIELRLGDGSKASVDLKARHTGMMHMQHMQHMEPMRHTADEH